MGFNRKWTNNQYEAFENLRENNAYIQKLMSDTKRGDMLLTLRPKNLTFYYKGNSLSDVTDNGTIRIAKQYLPVISKFDDKTIRRGKELTEDSWKELIEIDNISFADCYSDILDKAQSSESPEAFFVSGLYKFSQVADPNAEVILLDIEASFGQKKRIDVVMYHKKLRQLMFLEVKKYRDNRLNIGGKIQTEIIEQLSCYRSIIKNERENIIKAYNDEISFLSKITDVDVPLIDPNNKILLGLLICNYARDDEKTVNDLVKKLQSKGFPGVSIGNSDSITDRTLKKWYNQIKKQTLVLE